MPDIAIVGVLILLLVSGLAVLAALIVVLMRVKSSSSPSTNVLPYPRAANVACTADSCSIRF